MVCDAAAEVLAASASGDVPVNGHMQGIAGATFETVLAGLSD